MGCEPRFDPIGIDPLMPLSGTYSWAMRPEPLGCSVRHNHVHSRVSLGAVALAVVTSLAACGSSNVKTATDQSTGSPATPTAAPVCAVTLAAALSATPSASSTVTGFAPGSPVGGALCQYDLGVPADYSSEKLGRHVLLTAGALRKITMDVQSLTPSNEVASCPPPEFVEVLNLVYADASTASLSISCAMVWQGHIHAMLTEPLANEAQTLLATTPSASGSLPAAAPGSTS